MPISWIIKLGGSLGNGHSLRKWLGALREVPAIIVPGGGIFADAVRSAQDRWQFDDPLAHQMAIVAMRQYAMMLNGIEPSLILASTESLLEHTPDRPPAHIWLPHPEELLLEPSVDASWRVTSDSLAIWLAQRLDIPAVLLVKSMDIAERSRSAETLTVEAIIDPAVPEFLVRGTQALWLSGPNDYENLTTTLAHPDRHFCSVVL